MISQAFAQGASLFSGLESLSSFLPLVLIFAVFYFFLIRPQQKKAQQHREMIGALRRGDRIVTNGGLVGTVVRLIDEREVELEISQGVQVRVIRSMVADVMAKTQPKTEALTKAAGVSEEGPGVGSEAESGVESGAISGGNKDKKSKMPTKVVKRTVGPK
jgi:preprotein translocase subunit YajC